LKKLLGDWIVEIFLLKIQALISNPLFQGTLTVIAMLFYFRDNFRQKDISESKKKTS